MQTDVLSHLQDSESGFLPSVYIICSGKFLTRRWVWQSCIQCFGMTVVILDFSLEVVLGWTNISSVRIVWQKTGTMVVGPWMFCLHWRLHQLWTKTVLTRHRQSCLNSAAHWTPTYLLVWIIQDHQYCWPLKCWQTLWVQKRWSCLSVPVCWISWYFCGTLVR